MASGACIAAIRADGPCSWTSWTVRGSTRADAGDARDGRSSLLRAGNAPPAGRTSTVHVVVSVSRHGWEARAGWSARVDGPCRVALVDELLGDVAQLGVAVR